MSSVHEIRQCTNDTCRLRFPMPQGERPGDQCPRCATVTVVQEVVQVHDEMIHSARTGRNSEGKRPTLAVLVDNVRSLFNVGSILRSADGAGFQQVYLCGITPTPENPKLAKTALGAQDAVAWTQYNNSLDCAATLQAQGATLWALEEHPNAASIFTTSLPPTPLVLVIGNEVTGIDPALLLCCDQIVAIPMLGVKRSLNVATAFGAAAVLISQQRHQPTSKPTN